LVQAAPTAPDIQPAVETTSSSNDLEKFKAEVHTTQEELKKKVEEANVAVTKLKDSI